MKFRHISLSIAFAFLALLAVPPETGAEPASPKAPAALCAKAEHVVLIVCDGLRPDSVTELNMPNLFQLAHEGVTFAHNHCVYPTSTEVNGTAFATGVFPEASGIIANREYRPGINPRHAVPTESREAIREGDKATGGKYIAVKTIAETVQAAGFPTAIAGTKGVALLHDRSETRVSEASRQSSLIISGRATPPLPPEVAGDLGAFPEVAFPNVGEDRWTTQALIQQAWKEAVPKFSLLWLSDPDYTQHSSAPGAAPALQALKSSDDNLGAVLAALDARGIRNKTDIFIVSDHGFSTIVNPPDMVEELRKAGFDAVREYSQAPTSGQILVVSLGGSVAFYVANHDSAVTGKLVDYLQRSPVTGVLFSREKVEGTFPLETVRVHSPGAPDLLVALRWHDLPNPYGVRGLILGGTGANAGRGMHASLSRYDLHNTLIAAGPDLKHGMVDPLPSGNTDVAPTILAILGIAPTAPMQGRILSEALNETVATTTPPPAAESTTLQASRKLDGATWNQHLVITKFGGTVYFEEGNGGLEIHDAK